MPRPKQVTITRDGIEAQVLESSVKAYERAGWTRADDGSSEGSSAQPEPAAENQAAPTKEEAQ